MLRLGALDLADDDPGRSAASPALISRALGDLASERGVGGAPGFAPGFAVEQLCVALVADAPRLAQAHVDRLIDCGVSVDAIFETYIPRAAARLGELWLEDRLGFAGVTLGMARLTEVFRRLSPAFLRTRAPGSAPMGRRALFALTPGESHALGVVMAADFFQRGGWSVRVELQADEDALERIVRAEPFDLVGLSAGSRRMIPAVRRAARRLRAAARPGARFVVGGPVVALEPDLAEEVGVDLAHAAAPAALDRLERGC